jgi:hypothetical protein
MANIKTNIHTYRYALDIAAEAKAYKELREKLRADKRHFFNVLAEPFGKEKHIVEDGPIELETDHLFADQWNSTTARVFDWYEAIYPNRKIKQGHYLDITDEMRELRRTTLICGYCGKNYPNGTDTFCSACLDSPYLKESDLYLLRLQSVGIYNRKFPPLTDEERASLLPRYVERQTTGKHSRAVAYKAKVRADVIKKYAHETQNAKTEHDGMLWLLDRDISIENCIYYDHTQTFSFGWRNPVSPEVHSRLLELLKDFPYKYEIKKISDTAA